MTTFRLSEFETFVSQNCGVSPAFWNELAVCTLRCYRARSFVRRTGLRLWCALRTVSSGREIGGSVARMSRADFALRIVRLAGHYAENTRFANQRWL